MPPFLPSDTLAGTRLRRSRDVVRDRLRLAIISSALHPDAPGALKLPLRSHELERVRVQAPGVVRAIGSRSSHASVKAQADGLAGGRAVALTRRAAAPKPPTPKTGTKTCTATLLLEGMRCIKRTSRFPEIENGADEIFIVGHLVDLDTGELVEVKKDLGSWAEGRSRTYDPRKVLGSLPLSVADLPNRAFCLLFLAEDDPGIGIAEFIEEIYEVAKTLFEELDQEEGADVPAGEEGASQVEIIIEVLIETLKFIFAWVGKDDIFRDDPIEIKSPEWTGTKTTVLGPRSGRKLTGYGADYRLYFRWSLQAD